MAGIVKKILDMWNNEEEYEYENDDQQEEDNSIITRKKSAKSEHSKILNIHRENFLLIQHINPKVNK